MKKLLLFATFLFLLATASFGSEFPPYNANPSFAAMFPEEQSFQSKEVEIFPNPVTEGRLTIKSEETFVLVQIMNITGEIVFNQEFPMGTNSEIIELNKLEKGMYLVRIGFSGRTNHTAKIIIK